MTIPQNEIDFRFDTFLESWNQQYMNAKYILTYLHSYPDILSKVKLNDIHNSLSIDSAQNEWLWLISKFTHPIDVEFFKPYYVPIQVDSIDCFIDISDEKYPIFEIHYFFYEPYKWYKKFIVEDISELLLAPDTGLDLHKVVYENDKKRWKDVDEFFAERRRLGFEGKLTIEAVKRDEINPDYDKEVERCLEVANNLVSISGVTAIVVGLLPFDLPIKLKKIDYTNPKPKISLKDVKLIRDLVFLLRTTGIRGVINLQADFIGSKNSSLRYFKNDFVLQHSNMEVLNNFVENCKSIKL